MNCFRRLNSLVGCSRTRFFLGKKEDYRGRVEGSYAQFLFFLGAPCLNGVHHILTHIHRKDGGVGGGAHNMYTREYVDTAFI